MRAVVTGGADFIGSPSCARTPEAVADNFFTGWIKNIYGFLQGGGALRRRYSRFRSRGPGYRGVEVLFHEAALPFVPRSLQDPVFSSDVNVVGATVVLKAAVDAGVRRLVYAASSSAYGNSGEKLKAETVLPKPRSPYASDRMLTPNTPNYRESRRANASR